MNPDVPLFQSVDELLEFLPPAQRRLTEALRRLVFECIPDAAERLSYNVPFYRRQKGICFIWPGAIAWGKVYEGVQFGFMYGSSLPDDGYLEKGTRKQVYMKIFHTTKDVDADRLRALLFEAADFDERNRRVKKSSATKAPAKKASAKKRK